MKGKIILISGPCGSGKSTVAGLLAQRSNAMGSVHMHTDDFYAYIKKGYIEPWKDGSGDQNDTVIRSAAACARAYAEGGYEVYVDGVVGPWFIDIWKELAENGADVQYVILRPGLEETVRRGLEREAKAEFPLTEQVFRDMWQMFAELGAYEKYALNTEGQMAIETVCVLEALLRGDAFCL